MTCAPWDAGRCEALWGNSTELGPWCCASFCYVDPSNCDPPYAAHATFTSSSLLFYSYESCSDASPQDAATDAAKAAFAAKCMYADSDGPWFNEVNMKTKEECVAELDSYDISSWKLSVDAEGGIPLRAYTWSGFRMTSVNGTFSTRVDATNATATKTLKKGDTRVVLLGERPSSVTFFGGPGGTTLSQVTGVWPGVFLALYQLNTDPYQTGSWSTVSMDDANGEIQSVTLRVLYGPRCGAPLSKFVYGRLRMQVNTTSLRQVSEIDGVEVLPTLEVRHLTAAAAMLVGCRLALSRCAMGRAFMYAHKSRWCIADVCMRRDAPHHACAIGRIARLPRLVSDMSDVPLDLCLY